MLEKDWPRRGGAKVPRLLVLRRPIQVRGAGAAAANAGAYPTVDEVIAHAWLRLFLPHAAVFSRVCCGSLVFHRCLILLFLRIVVVYLAAGVLDDVIVYGAVR